MAGNKLDLVEPRIRPQQICPQFVARGRYPLTNEQPDGRADRIGPAWTELGRPAAGYFTKRTAEAWLREALDQARRGTLPGMVRTGVTFADAAAEWLRFIEEDRERKPSTLVDYRSALRAHLLPAFGEQPIESITTEDIEAWRRSLVGLSNRSKNKLLIQLHGIFRRAQMVWAIQVNPLARVEKHPMRPSRSPAMRSGDG